MRKMSQKPKDQILQNQQPTFDLPEDADRTDQHLIKEGLISPVTEPIKRDEPVFPHRIPRKQKWM